jgi:hypothetical protein
VLSGVEALIQKEWTPNKTLVLELSLDSTLLESWSMRYAAVQDPMGLPVAETRYFASTLLVRQLIVVAESLPATRNGATECKFKFVSSEEPTAPSSFLAEEFA